MQSPGAPSKEDTGRTRKYEGRTRKNERDGSVEAKGVDYRREEGVEGTGREMEVLHEAEEPGTRIPAGLLEAVHGGCVLLRGVGDAVLLHALVGELAFALVEPAGGQGCVWEEPEAE